MLMSRLNTIYGNYYIIVEKYFNNYYAESIKNGSPPHIVAKEVLKNDLLKNRFDQLIKPLSEEIISFWQANYEIVLDEFIKIQGFMTKLGGDIGPQISDKLFERAAIYFDTVIIREPLLVLLTKPTADAALLIKYGINQLYYQKYVLSRTDPPLAIILPDKYLFDDRKQIQTYSNSSELDTTLLCSELYQKQFSSFNAVEKFLLGFDSYLDAYNAIEKKEMIYLDESYPLGSVQQFEKAEKFINNSQYLQILNFKKNDPRIISFTLKGRMMQATDIIVSAQELNATPIVTAPVSFHWLKTKVNITQQFFLANTNEILNLGITNALTAKNFSWLENLELNQLLEMRNQGKMIELRKKISCEIGLLNNVTINNIDSITKKIDSNLKDLFNEHHNELCKQKEKFQGDLKSEALSLLLSLMVTIVPLIGVNIPQIVLSLSPYLASYSVLDSLKTYHKYRKEIKILKQTPAAILLNAFNSQK